MDTAELKKIWNQKYQVVPQQLIKIREIKAAATAFNANIDAVIKLSAERLAELIKQENLTLAELKDVRQTRLCTPKDVIKGIFKCFTNGIAEEWISEEKSVYEWMKNNLGYDRLQTGGQGGIVANVLAAAGVQSVFVHANSLPKMQAEQFEARDNLLSFDENGHVLPAHQIDRSGDTPLVHWIIEFDRGDILKLEGQEFRCPKSNRFIATYDPLNLKLATDPNFISHMRKCEVEYVVLSGFHALTENNNGVQLIKDMAEEIKIWKKNCPQCLYHLEIASTQDLAIRQAIIKYIAPLMDSMGINERETMDILEVIDEKDLSARCRRQTTSENLFSALVKIKEKTGVPRIQLHMFGLYMILQDQGFCISPQADLEGMMTAATIAAAKAGTGNITDMLWAHGKDVSDVGLIEAENLSVAAGQSDLVETGIGRYRQWDLIIAPTILIEKPLTLVGMGDTISSLSLVAAR